MSVTITQPEKNIKAELDINNNRYGIIGKQILESSDIYSARTIINADRKNLIINGGFDIWQRGTGLSSNNAYLVDRWRSTYYTGGLTQYVERVNVDNSNIKTKYAARVHSNGVNTTSNSVEQFRQTFESSVGLDNGGNTQPMAVSFWAKGIKKQDINLYGSNSSDDQTFTITSDWQYYSFTFRRSAFSLLEFEFTPSDIIDFTVTQIQLEIGSEATEFEQRHIAVEYELCRRYARLADLNNQAAKFSYEMRATPSVSGSGPYLYEAEL